MTTVAEIGSEISARFRAAQEIQRRFPDGPITDPEAKAEVEKLLAEVTDLEQKHALHQDAELQRERIDRGLRDYREPANGNGHHQPRGEPNDQQAWKSLGDIFLDDGEYRRLRESGVFDSPNQIVNFNVDLGRKTSMYQRLMQYRRGAKALVYSGSAVGGAMVTPDYRPGVVDLLQRPLTVLDVVPTAQTDSNTISYIREDTFTNAAAMVAEATATTGASGLKPESAIAFSRQSLPVRTAATWVPVTNQMLADAPMMRGIIDQRLMVMLEQTLETQILTGNGTGENFTGILNSGISTIARGADSQADAIYKAAVVVAVTGQAQPDTIVLNPLDWQTIRLARESAATATPGSYLMGPPSMVGADTLWGFRVLISQAMTQGTALAASMALGGMFFEREGATIRSGLINDQFVRNMQTLLVEARGQWITFRPTAFCRVTGM
jgi:HK97 family phage major capsid protein